MGDGRVYMYRGTFYEQKREGNFANDTLLDCIMGYIRLPFHCYYGAVSQFHPSNIAYYSITHQTASNCRNWRTCSRIGKT